MTHARGREAADRRSDQQQEHHRRGLEGVPRLLLENLLSADEAIGEIIAWPNRFCGSFGNLLTRQLMVLRVKRRFLTDPHTRGSQKLTTMMAMGGFLTPRPSSSCEL